MHFTVIIYTKGDELEPVSFYKQVGINKDIEDTFIIQKERIIKVIPNAEIHHVGSSAIPNSLTKGDLDIQVRVSSKSFSIAVEKLSKLYKSNEGSIKTNEFRAFEDDTISPPVGVQLTVFNSEFDFFWKFRDILLKNDTYRNDYDNLKRKFEGEKMNKYRESKNEFFNKLKETKEFQEL